MYLRLSRGLLAPVKGGIYFKIIEKYTLIS